jgi:hypothetical protein
LKFIPIFKNIIENEKSEEKNRHTVLGWLSAHVRGHHEQPVQGGALTDGPGMVDRR